MKTLVVNAATEAALYNVLSLSKEDLEKLSREQLLSLLLDLKASWNWSVPSFKTNNASSHAVDSVKRSKKPFDFERYGKRKIALRVCYLGWQWDGFASQPHSQNTVEAHLFRALEKTKLIESRETCEYTRAARTDKGVSAIENVISLIVRSQVILPSTGTEEFDYPRILNAVLPTGIFITGWCDVDASFHARFSANYRIYHYYFRPNNLNLLAMQRAAQYFVGRHDFRNFCKADVLQVQNFCRVITSCDIKLVTMTSENVREHSVVQLPEGNQHEDFLRLPDDSISVSSVNILAKLVVKGQAFLWHQIRCMASVLFMVGEGLEKEDIIGRLLDFESFGPKPLFRMANEIPLVLSEVGFQSLRFSCSSKAMKNIHRELQEVLSELESKVAIVKDILSHLFHGATGIREPYLLDREQGPHRPLELRHREASIDEKRERKMSKC